MASGHTTMHPVRLATTHDVRPEIELQLFQPAILGLTVRVTVFDEDLFRTGALAQHYVRVLAAFIGSTAPVMPSVVRDAAPLIADGSNGVLLTFERAVVGEVPRGGAQIHRKWAFGPAQNVKGCTPRDVFVDIALGMRDQHNELSFGPVIRLPAAKAHRERRLVIIVSNPATNEIIYSNTWRKGTLAASNAQRNPTIVDSKAVEAGVSAKVGGSGEGTGAPAPAGRALPPTDITGMYEAFASAGAEPAETLPSLMVALNLAGGAVAGWWAPPPETITAHAHHRLTQPPLSAPLNRGEFGVLLGHFEGDEFRILWGPTPVSRDPSPELVGALSASPSSNTGVGTIRIEAEERLRMTLRRGDTSTVLFLRMTEPTPRWSNATIDIVLARAAESSPFIKKSAHYQERPIPLAFWTLLQQDMLATGVLGRLIVAHRTTTERNARRRLLTDISNYLDRLPQNEFADAVVAHFTLFASNVEITIQGVTRSTYDWLHDIAAEFMSGLVTKDTKPETIPSLLPSGFRAVGVVPQHLFVYNVEFFSLGAKVELGIAAGAYAFEAHVRRNVLKSGIEREPPPGDPWFDLPLKRKSMFGGFGDIGIAVGDGVKTGASAMLSKVAFRSFHDVRPLNFNRATFYVVSAAALKLSGASLSFTGASTAVVVMTVENLAGARASAPVRMVAGVDSFLPPIKTPSQLIKKKPLKVSFSLFSLSLGWGWMIEREPTDVRPPTPDTPPKQTMGRAQRSFGAYYRKNSATLEGRNLSALEEALAIERALFVSGGGHARAAGHASPEGPDNAGLSQRRADNAIEVVRSAFRGQLAVSAGAIGYGDRAAIQEGLIRPENIPPGPAGAAQRLEYAKQERGIFVEFRKVMLWVSGTLLIEISLGKVLPTGEGG